ncbi:DNA replication ATP-dependent helicase/nuclease DNA2 [Porphyridium purpureum]|uniref:DNA replication ATP-dependent helicase/nuclease DNA2 n=1 Tax=Porphyridium purpureum TaxID=35688 RepID=A0A5J4Z1K7_PORPP|nr:DNA replication ATP-dependent helicase/nuclease DNA2 [Porphyridium purpureum]|eukprot:POR6161..scf295_1
MMDAGAKRHSHASEERHEEGSKRAKPIQSCSGKCEIEHPDASFEAASSVAHVMPDKCVSGSGVVSIESDDDEYDIPMDLVTSFESELLKRQQNQGHERNQRTCVNHAESQPSPSPRPVRQGSTARSPEDATSKHNHSAGILDDEAFDIPDELLVHFDAYDQKVCSSSFQSKNGARIFEAASGRLLIVQINIRQQAQDCPKQLVLLTYPIIEGGSSRNDAISISAASRSGDLVRVAVGSSSGVGSESGTRAAIVEIDTSRPLWVTLEAQWIQNVADVRTHDVCRVVRCDRHNNFFAWDPLTHSIVVHDDENLFILNPDVLVSGTSLASSFGCSRQTIISEQIREQGQMHQSALVGSLVHSLFQIALQATSANHSLSQQDSAQLVRSRIDPLLLGSLDAMYLAQADEAELRAVLDANAEPIAAWIEDFFSRAVSVQIDDMSNSGAHRAVRFSSVLTIEENVWSPVLGLKGIVDAVVEAECDGVPYLLPLELKTGGSSGVRGSYHRAQVILYCFLVADRYDTALGEGILAYIGKTDDPKAAPRKTSVIPCGRSEYAPIFVMRNHLSAYLVNPSRGPTSLEGVGAELPRLNPAPGTKCSRCFVQHSCMVHHKLVENGTSASAETLTGESGVFEEHTAHLNKESNADATFYNEWRRFLEMEEHESAQHRKDIWCVPSFEQERRGKCLSNLRLLVDLADGVSGGGANGWMDPSASQTAARMSGSSAIPKDDEELDRFMVSFERVPETQACALDQSVFHANDFVLLSVEVLHASSRSPVCQKAAVAMGFVRSISSATITVETRTDLKERMRVWQKRSGDPSRIYVFRIDKDELLTSFRLMRFHLASLVHGGHGRALDDLEATAADLRAQRLRELVIEKKPPCFANDSRALLEQTEKGAATAASLMEYLNTQQQAAVDQILRAQDYSLILGLPGTGKTKLLSATVEIALQLGLSVLLCSHTHHAVDNVLLRLQAETRDGRLLRLGRAQQVHPSLHSALMPTLSTLGDMERYYQNVALVACTCMALSHSIFSRRKFDIVLVDEASQISVPGTLGVLRLAKRCVVLVGDHHQLPPLVRSPHNRTMNTQSLFEHLTAAFPNATVRLNEQYRMARDIMELSNHLVYDGSLVCGTPEVALRTLRLSPSSGKSTWQDESSGDLRRILDPENRLLFLNTDQTPSCTESLTGAEDRERDQGIRDGGAKGGHAQRVNVGEKNLIVAIVRALVQHGAAPEDITCLSPYRAQVGLIRAELRRSCNSSMAAVRSLTIDESQGLDQPCVVISLVRSNEKRVIGGLLRDWRRLNVAITRAQAKLILVGSAQTLQEGSLFTKRLVDFLTRPEFHVCDDFSQLTHMR